MTRVAAVLVTPAMADGAPPGVDPAEFLMAVAEDTYEMVAGLEFVEPVILSAGVPGLDDIVWPGTLVLSISSPAEAFAALPYATEGVVVSADAPDLPPLLIGKLFRALGRAHVAICPAEGGGAVAVAARLPLPDWADPGFDDPDLVVRLRRQAPGPRMVATGPGWHRLRKPADVGRLDPGLEGWDNTRALLS
ncbi:hypothetical protein [Microtetraspora sp. NBRC 16547]|uniref:hypothetical protein n=1 Tax=Microtetraspora sp. NBRC 16547 TaxID=3030993 RepID=UPI0024A3772B|nr:hypothetical protein [Microtetraspora sp. NBRC 16547]GLW97799.1 hypothetical protein Misp02_18860 [Microtetraspora sp. NBRC 16547]